jgi:hypothetical protein
MTSEKSSVLFEHYVGKIEFANGNGFAASNPVKSAMLVKRWSRERRA